MENNLVLDNGVVREATADEEARILMDQEEAAVRAVAEVAKLLAAYMQEFRDMRRELLNALTGIAIAEDMLDEFKVAREALLNIPQIPAVANATTAAEAKAACKAAYMAVVASSPPEFILAFKELNG